jgi:hypothetical protein
MDYAGDEFKPVKKTDSGKLNYKDPNFVFTREMLQMD